MTFYKSNGDKVPGHIVEMAEQARTGEVSRREFLAMASIFGASTAMAYGMLGLAAPTPAMAQETPKKGGVIKISMFCKANKDPRLADWSEIANGMRQSLEPLIKFTRDFTFGALRLAHSGGQNTCRGGVAKRDLGAIPLPPILICNARGACFKTPAIP